MSRLRAMFISKLKESGVDVRCGARMGGQSPEGCGKDGYMTLDHIVPKSEGGTNRVENLQLFCRRCHVKNAAESVSPDRKEYRKMKAFRERLESKGLLNRWDA